MNNKFVFFAVEEDLDMRAFVAAYFEGNEELNSLFGKFSSDPRIRKVSEKQKHVTLLFYENIERSDAGKICEILSSVKEKRFSSVSMGVTGFPDPGRARVVVLLLESPELTGLHEYIAAKSPGIYDRKKFRSHITLARARGKPADVRDYMTLGRGMRIEFGEIALVKSELTPEGPVYTKLCEVQLM